MLHQQTLGTTPLAYQASRFSPPYSRWGWKGIAYAVTGSIGLFSDALESGVNLLAAVTAYVALILRPGPRIRLMHLDKKKLSTFQAVWRASLSIITAIGIVGYAVRMLIQPEPLSDLKVGAIIGIDSHGNKPDCRQDFALPRYRNNSTDRT